MNDVQYMYIMEYCKKKTKQMTIVNGMVNITMVRHQNTGYFGKGWAVTKREQVSF